MSDETESLDHKKPASGAPKLLIKIALILMIAVGSYMLVQPYLPQSPLVPPIAPAEPSQIVRDASAEKIMALSQRLETAETRLTGLEEKLEATQAQLSAVPPVAPSTEPTTGEDSSAKINQLERTVYMLQKRVENITPLHHLALLNGFADIQKAVRQNETFASQLTQMTQIAQDRPTTLKLLSDLQPFAAQAVSTPDALKQSFDTTAKRALAKDDDTNSLMGNLRTLIRIRKEGTPQGSDDESIIARAETKLEAGDVAASVAELKTLSPESSLIFSGWISSAQAYAKLHSTLVALERDLARVDEKPSEPAAGL